MVKTHPKAAVHSGDEHDGYEDDETADEEGHHRLETAEETRLTLILSLSHRNLDL